MDFRINWLLIAVIVVFVIFLWRGHRRGFLRMLFSLVSWIVILAIVAWAGPRVDTFLLNQTSLCDSIAERSEERIRGTVQSRLEDGASSALDDVEDSDGSSVDASAALSALGIALPSSVLDKISDGTAGISESVISAISQGAAGAVDEMLSASGAYAAIARRVAELVVRGISYIFVLILAFLIVRLISVALNIVSHIPILRGINRFFGLIAGGVYALLIIWIAFAIIAIFGTTAVGAALASYIYDSRFLTALYEGNVLLALLVGGV